MVLFNCNLLSHPLPKTFINSELGRVNGKTNNNEKEVIIFKYKIHLLVCANFSSAMIENRVTTELLLSS